ncbi:MAG: MFS transporter [Gammaproteobacteria bacterium]|nr:MFS transporter [Gammaproteobacteria bacterium]
MKMLLGVLSLLLSTALLLTGHGMQLTLLPLRAAENGLSELLIGFSASAYFLGFVAGCFGNPRLVARIGHIRAFAVLTALMICAILCLELTNHWAAWLALRFLTGVSICGLYTVIESWLNSQVTAQSRGRVLSVYTFITLSAMTGGQFLINVGPVSSSVPFTVAALCMALAILPVGLTRRMAPEPVEATHTGFSLLLQRSRSAFAGALLSGLVTGSFWSLGAVFARRYSEDQFDITLFMSIAIAGGALVQYPIGWLSDRVDRRRVLILLAVGCLLSSVAVALSTEQAWFLVTVALFGATAMPLYAISLATAADVAESSEFVTLGTSVLMLNALGAAIAPLFLGQLMSHLAATALFWSFAVLSALFGIYLLTQLRSPRAVSVTEQTPFLVAGNDAAPAAFEMDPRQDDEGGTDNAITTAIKDADQQTDGSQPPHN